MYCIGGIGWGVVQPQKRDHGLSAFTRRFPQIVAIDVVVRGGLVACGCRYGQSDGACKCSVARDGIGPCIDEKFPIYIAFVYGMCVDRGGACQCKEVQRSKGFLEIRAVVDDRLRRVGWNRYARSGWEFDRDRIRC